jgi:8-hydroxy-5-deazaflavin:NADPH oxidoreductase
VRVTAAFHTLSADLLADLDEPIDGDILFCGDDAAAKADVAKLIALLPGARAIDAGPLENARLLESAAALVISLNIRHKVKHSGLHITGLPAESKPA